MRAAGASVASASGPCVSERKSSTVAHRRGVSGAVVTGNSDYFALQEEPLLERAIVDAHDYYGIYDAMKAQGKSLGRITPIPVVLLSNEMPDQYEAEMRRRIHPHNDMMNSVAANLFRPPACQKNHGGPVTLYSHYASSASLSETSEEAFAGAPFPRQRQAGRIII